MARYTIYPGEVPSSIFFRILENCKELYGVTTRVAYHNKLKVVELDTLLPLTHDEKEIIRKGVSVGLIISEK